MSQVIRICGIDPALRNTGLAAAEYNIVTGKLVVTAVSLIQTARLAGKTVRLSSDDFRCAKDTLGQIKSFIAKHGLTMAVAEIPSGTQSARGAFSNGICCGMLAGVPLTVLEVNPTEVKLASVGDKKATKDQIIQWAVGKWPNAGWMTRKFKGEVVLLNDNEHMADACAAIAAGLLTVQFAQSVAMLNSLRSAALEAH